MHTGYSETCQRGSSLHELSLTQNLIEIAEKHARREGALFISSITVEIGALSGVIPEAVEFAFETCTNGTLAEGASLEIQHVPGVGRCLECGQECPLEALTDPCPSCHSFSLEILRGQDMLLIEMEIDG
jgi:hydrogenase nickel incorporation protein HypA/HybF